jgi:hypothetical protein
MADRAAFCAIQTTAADDIVSGPPDDAASMLKTLSDSSN